MRWEEMSAPAIDVLDRETTAVLVPVGSVEQHGNHMPVGTDTILAHAVALGAAEKRPNTVVLPAPWYGFSAHHLRFQGTVSLPAATMIDLTERIVDGVVAQGFRRVLIVNGHGGNGGVIDVMAATLGHRHYRRARIAALTYFVLAADAIASLRESEAGGMGHACEFETAMMLHLRPDLVRMDKAVAIYPDPGSRYLNTDLLGSPKVRTYLDFRDLSASGTLGDPLLATPEKGAAFFAACADSLAAFIDDFARWPIEPRQA